jgi:hypothetical protein
MQKDEPPKSPTLSLERLLFPFLVSFIVVVAFCAFFITEDHRYDIAIRRISMEHEQATEALKIERLRVEKITTSIPVQLPSPGLDTGTGNAIGLSLLRELIVKIPPASGSGFGGGSQRSTSVIAGMVDALVSAGQITASAAKSLKDELQKAGLEIGVEAAKALIDRFIKVHEKPVAGGDKSGPVVQGATQINMYCNASTARTSLPPIRTSVPKKACS